MGVPDLWDIVGPAIQQRVPLSLFSSDFQRREGRPLRVAIDSYIWLFETGHVPNSENSPNAYKIVQGFLSRIWLLIGCNVSFIIVFDGALKPSFKRNFNNENDKFANFQQLYNQSSYTPTNENLKEVVLLKKLLNLLNITYVDAAGEAESECSRLQDLGVVDYVISNDSDSMLFGAKKILRNFSKLYENCEQDEYYVEPVELDRFFLANHIDRFRLIFFAILRGADYNAGVDKVGTTRARRISFVGTKLNMTADGCIDFYDQFLSIFYQDNFLTELPNLELVCSRYQKFFEDVENEVLMNTVSYFGRNDPLKLKNLPPYYIALLYFYPILIPSVFKFIPGTMNCQDSQFDEIVFIGTNTIPQLRSFKIREQDCVQFKRHGGGLKGTIGLSRYNLKTKALDHELSIESSYNKLEKLNVERLVNDLQDKLPNVTDSKTYIIKNCVRSLMLYFLSNTLNMNSLGIYGIYVKASKFKILPSRGDIGRQAKKDYELGHNNIFKWVKKMYMFKYRPEILLRNYLGVDIHSDPETEMNGGENMVWISEETITNLKLTKIIDDFERSLSTTAKTTQSSTLESLGLLLRSPKKSPSKNDSMTRRRNSLNLRSPSKKVVKSPRKQPKKSTQRSLDIGQQTITNFLRSEGKQRLQLETFVNDGDNIVLISSEEGEDDLGRRDEHELIPLLLRDIINTPSKLVPFQTDHQQLSPMKNKLGVKKLFVEKDIGRGSVNGEENDLGRPFDVLDRIIRESKLSDDSSESE